jgi:CheY-like chemotaxis protein
LTILIIEDDRNDADLLKRGLSRAGYKGSFEVTQTGDEAFNYLEGRAEFSDRSLHPLPDVILLDLFLPGVSGLDVLSRLKSESKFARIPVFVITGLPYQTAIADAYVLGAKTFFFKPLDDGQMAALASLCNASVI